MRDGDNHQHGSCKFKFLAKGKMVGDGGDGVREARQGRGCQAGVMRIDTLPR